MDINSLTKAELVEHGSKLGLELSKSSNKETLIEKIESHQIEGIEDAKADQAEALEQNQTVAPESAQPLNNNEHPKFAKFKKGTN